MFLFTSDPNKYVIIHAEYTGETPLKQHREKVISDFLQQYNEDLFSQGIGKVLIPSENFLIIWNDHAGKPLKAYTGHSIEWLLHVFSLKIKASQSALPVSVIIQSPDTLCDEENIDLSTLLQRLIILFDGCGIIPTFLENDFFEKLKISDLPAPLQNYIDDYKDVDEEDGLRHAVYDSVHELSKEKFEQNINNRIFHTMFLSLKNLMSFMGCTFPEDGSSLFIHQYFLWQRGDSKVKECANALNDVSTPSFYRYIAEFESSVFYPEYLCAYENFLKGSMRHGNTPDPIDFLLVYHRFEETAHKENKEINYLSIANKYDELFIPSEVPRVKLACEQKIKVLKKKGLYKPLLEERGISDNELH